MFITQDTFSPLAVVMHLFNKLYYCECENNKGSLFFCQTYDEWKDMLPDLSEYNWVIPDFVWELSEQIDLGKSFYFSALIHEQLIVQLLCIMGCDSLSYQPFLSSLLNLLSSVPTDKLAKALPEIEEIAKLLPDLDKIGENFTFLKSLLSTGE